MERYITDKDRLDVQIGNRLREIRERRKYTINDVIETIDCSEKTIRNYESGQGVPLYRLLEFCNLYDCDIDFLLGKYDSSNKDSAFICENTGLSDTSIHNLRIINENEKKYNEITNPFFLESIIFFDYTKFADEIIKNMDKMYPHLQAKTTKEYLKIMLRNEKYYDDMEKAYSELQKKMITMPCDNGVEPRGINFEEIEYIDILSKILKKKYGLDESDANELAFELSRKYFEVISPIYEAQYDFTVSKIFMKIIDETTTLQGKERAERVLKYPDLVLVGEL